MRSEGDTWDITTSVGSTALFVATARALEAQKPDPLAVDPYAELFCRAVGGSWADVLDGTAPDHELLSEDFGAHFVTFQGARTRYFDAYFQRAADAGARQVVVVAAGLDSRAFRLPWPDGTTVFELDRPQVLDFKSEVLAAHRVQPRAERREIAVDLRDDWPRALRDSGFDPAQPSAWIAEGLLIYLPAAAQEQLFRGIDGLASRGSHVAVEDGTPLPADEFAAKVEEERAAPDGDQRPFFQLVYNEQHAPATDWFGARGWTAVGTPLTDYITGVGRALPDPGSEPASMLDRITLVTAVKP
ncbi:SAM-dependent methyltransferase [Mycobacterium intermedium]|uniref:S-adenosyl-L-methionine-dependent methyltransferase n=1 Tax=Mycobacterium intermedium TaxID=28445 RepID=A0A1E3S8P1_MYCIE|nr:class I SAM-dependent methyltransferase [Mycobacterium intermedium]MCV6965020.1 class I SAM-dependent methyltransferase [Mycobacterium intermedium]ODQ98441.1 SAM-dependent methyltransferase [Mycobacterium intermedium]OPE48228.1 SAM-dependent methyltransferase [Mycobacterium intermedium]ORB06907.1 SAM-dependent methyltransferase [Mycobacterium intermedium]